MTKRFEEKKAKQVEIQQAHELIQDAVKTLTDSEAMIAQQALTLAQQNTGDEWLQPRALLAVVLKDYIKNNS